MKGVNETWGAESPSRPDPRPPETSLWISRAPLGVLETDWGLGWTWSSPQKTWKVWSPLPFLSSPPSEKPEAFPTAPEGSVVPNQRGALSESVKSEQTGWNPDVLWFGLQNKGWERMDKGKTRRTWRGLCAFMRRSETEFCQFSPLIYKIKGIHEDINTGIL